MTKLERKYTDASLKITKWEDIKPYFTELKNRKITSVAELKKWWQDRSELESIISENVAWRYIKMNCHTNDEKLAEDFNYFVKEIDPKISPYNDILNKKLANSPYIQRLLEKDDRYNIPTRSLKKSIELFREENIPIFSKLQEEQQEYGTISSKMSVEYDGKEITLQQAGNLLKDTNRELRKSIYHKINDRRLLDKESLNLLLDKLIEKRHQVAQNTGFANYTDYKYEALGRFDYTQKAVEEFRNSIAKVVVPIVAKLDKKRKEKLGLETLRPWDLAVDIDQKPALKPFSTADELLEKSIQAFHKIKPQYGVFLSEMRDKGYLDLDSRKNKAPGGFNYPLHESNVPFIYMNATESLRDLETLMHEGGHAIHAFLCANMPVVDFKDTPSEVAELASMSMELISMDAWDIFFSDKMELKRAKTSQLEGIFDTLPWVATVDEFQHELYKNPTHSHTQREEMWNKITKKYSSGVVNYEGLENYRGNSWQRQLHIFEVPFYYIEYGMAQLGAIAMWKNYKENPQKGLEGYEKALKLGYTKTIPEIYEAANIKFDFSETYIQELMFFLEGELEY